MFRRPQFWLFLALIGVLVLMVVRLVNVSDYIKRANTPAADVVTKSAAQTQVFPVDPSLGASNAEVTIIEFSDFECPYCAEIAPVLKKLVQENASKVRLVWKDFPLPTHSEAQGAAEAAQCAGRQGKFWQYHELLFTNQSRLGSGLYQELATNLKLDLGEFSTCVTNGATKTLIERNVAEGRAIGVDGTPYFIINGQAVSGALTEAELKSYLK